MRDWDDHRLILTLHRFGTLRAAGEALGVTHTTIARRLAAIESGETTPVFTRVGRAYQATAYGRERVALAERMESLDQSATRLQRSAGDTLSGPLSLSVPQAILQHLLFEPIGQFTRDHPNIALSMIGTDRLADLDRGDADVVVRGHPTPPEHLVGRRICSVGVNDYAHRTYLRETPRAQLKWIARDRDALWRKTTHYSDVPVGLVIDDIQSRFHALERGQGLSRAACFMADPHPDVIRLGTAASTHIYDLWVLTHPDLKTSPKVKAIMQVLTDALLGQKVLIEG